MLGERIRAIRKQRGLTSVELARRAGVSQGLVSQIENGRSDPSLETLRHLAEALAVPLFDLFQDQAPQRADVLRVEERPFLTPPRSALSYEKLSPPSPVLEILRGRLEPHASSSGEPHSHPATECLVVESGELTVEVDGEPVVLGAGDSCSFDSRRPHRYLNAGDDEVVFLIVATPPSF